MTRSLLDFENNIRPVKINGNEEKYIVTVNPNNSNDPLAVIDNIISDFELLSITSLESKVEARKLIQENDKLYTFQVTKNMFPVIISNEMQLNMSPVLYFNFHKILCVFETKEKKFDLRFVIHNNKTVFDSNVKNARTDYTGCEYRSRIFHLIELIEDIFDTTIDQLSNGLITP